MPAKRRLLGRSASTGENAGAVKDGDVVCEPDWQGGGRTRLSIAVKHSHIAEPVIVAPSSDKQRAHAPVS